VEVDPTRMCELLVGLPAVNVLGIEDSRVAVVVVHIESCQSRPGCLSCGTPAWVKDRPLVELVDLSCFGRPARLVWHKHRWYCPDGDCDMGSWTGEDRRIASSPCGADRSGRPVGVHTGGPPRSHRRRGRPRARL
jgi:transposase